MTIKKTIAIASAKGGVGKSTICSFIASSLSKDYRIGVLDADIYGPNQDILFNINDKKILVNKDNQKPYQPKIVDGIAINSLGFLLDNKAAIWRGPMLSSAINQLYEKTNWGDLDYLLIDMPPGTGDAYLTVCEKIVPDFVILISTLSNLSIADLKKTENVFMKLNTDVLGIVLNNIHQKRNLDTFNLDSNNLILDRIEYNEGFIDSTHPFDELEFNSFLSKTLTAIKNYD